MEKEISIRFDFLEEGDVFRFNGCTEKNVKVSINQYKDEKGNIHILKYVIEKVIIFLNNQ